MVVTYPLNFCYHEKARNFSFDNMGPLKYFKSSCGPLLETSGIMEKKHFINDTFISKCPVTERIFSFYLCELNIAIYQ